MDPYMTLTDGRRVKAYPTPTIHPIHTDTPVPPTTRLDFHVLPSGTVVNKLGPNESGKLIVIDHTVRAGFDLDGALAWCRANGWTVRTWPGGARAWHGPARPVRTRAEIQRLRDELQTYPRPELEGKAHTLDLAFDL